MSKEPVRMEVRPAREGLMGLQSESIRIEIGPVIEKLVQSLASGATVWGGGVGIGPSKSGRGYILRDVNEHGEGRHVYHKTALSAAWAYLRHVGGSVTATVSQERCRACGARAVPLTHPPRCRACKVELAQLYRHQP